VDIVQLLTPRRFGDDRGWFSETYSRREAEKLGLPDFVQDNHSLSRPAGTLRGLHLQAPPHAQAKLVRCLRGAILDIVVDIRRGSPTYGRWVSVELSAETGRQIYVPVGFAHGFVTLVPDTEVSYKTSDYYAPECEAGIRYDDPEIGVDWPTFPGGYTLSGKDEALPPLAAFDSPFAFDGEPLPSQLG
jgi:dTDP-4-dehydrorhamnose 3,5-epimerase